MKPSNPHTSHTPLFGITTVGEKGQIVIPADIRLALKLKKGEKLMIIGREDGLGLVRPSQMEPLLAGLAKFTTEVKKAKK